MFDKSKIEYNDSDIPEIYMSHGADQNSENSSENSSKKDYYNVEPLPESERPRRDGPGGN